MKPEYLEPFKRIYPTKGELLSAWSEWFESKAEEWDLFTLTVVFKAGGKIPRPDRWEATYKNQVLLKIRRVLERNEKNYEFAIPYDDFCYYEFDEESLFRKTGLRKPHHIHALIPIRKASTYRFWSVDDQGLQNRLIKDLYSIKTVGSILVEPVRKDGIQDWIGYCVKGKII